MLYSTWTTIRNELHHARKAWPGTLEDPCLLSGHVYKGTQETVALMKDLGTDLWIFLNLHSFLDGAGIFSKNVRENNSVEFESKYKNLTSWIA